MIKGLGGEDRVKRSLWQRNYRAKDVSRFTHYDLWVDGKYRVEVKTTSLTSPEDNQYIRIRPEEFDVLCVVVENATSHNIYYLKDKKFLKECAPNKAYTSDKNEGAIIINSNHLKDFFTKKPSEVFK